MRAARRGLLRGALGTALFAGLGALGGCGWAPLYADKETEPTDAELRAIRVAPIPERIGQRLALGLRTSFNPSGIETKQLYVLRVVLQVVRVDLGVQTQGLGTLGRVDVYASYYLSDIRSNTQLTSGTSHTAESFDILADLYSNVVAEEDARNRTAEELRRDLVNRLTIFLQNRRAAGLPAVPAPGTAPAPVLPPLPVAPAVPAGYPSRLSVPTGYPAAP